MDATGELLLGWRHPPLLVEMEARRWKNASAHKLVPNEGDLAAILYMIKKS